MANKSCDWCRDDGTTAGATTGVCSRCNGWRKGAEKARRRLEIGSALHDANPRNGDLEFWVALELPSIARLEGELFGLQEPSDPVDGYELETMLGDIAKAAGFAELFRGRASVFEDELSDGDRLKVWRVLAPLGRQIFRKGAKDRAKQLVCAKHEEHPAGQTR